jgi:transcriptional regulator
MFVPHYFAVDDEPEIRRMVAGVGSAQLVTVGSGGEPLATLLPIIWEGDTVIAHMARANPHWQQIEEGARALLIVTGPQAYISPSWYAAKAEHGRVVPTWNYSAVHLAGWAQIHEDMDWLRASVDDLVERHEADRAAPWRTADAPAKFVRGQLRAIVGIEVSVERVDAKAKLSQNRSSADRVGVARGLAGEDSPGAAAVAQAMASHAPRMAIEPSDHSRPGDQGDPPTR